MKVALVGISGRVGSRLADELVRRGHAVIGIARDIARLAPRPSTEFKQADATDAAQLSVAISGCDALISAAKFQSTNAGALTGAVKSAGVGRLLVVGRAGSLEVAPGVTLVDTPGFPDAYKPVSPGRPTTSSIPAERECRQLDILVSVGRIQSR